MNSAHTRIPRLLSVFALLAALPLAACFESDDDPQEEEWCDSATLLCWQDPHSVTGMTFQEANQYCIDLVWNGHTNWELPTIFQLRTLIERCDSTDVNGPCQPGAPSVDCLDSDCTTNCFGCAQGGGPDTASGGCYWPQELDGTCGAHWSATELGDVGGAAWYVNFITAQVGDSALESTMTVRCVRPMPWEEDTGKDAVDDVQDVVELDVPDTPDIVLTDTTNIKDTAVPDMTLVETIDPYDCKDGDTKCIGDEFWLCNESGEWALEYDCFVSWQLCGETTYGGFGCTEYPDCTVEQEGERRCWRDRALKCVTGGIDWQLKDDCSDFQGMYCEPDQAPFVGKCLHNAGLTWVDPATSLEWQRPVFPDHDEYLDTWLVANTYCNDLVWADHDDWRLPTISELRTLVAGCPGTMTGGSCAYTDACMEDCWEGDCWGCTEWEGPTINVYDEDRGGYIINEFEYEFSNMSWSMYVWSGTHCVYYTDRPEAQYCQIDFRSGAIDVKYNDTKADPGYPICVRTGN
ncbi:MAG TPA: DUF1566 domain-containing protein [Myxococcota bacterium]|nr:DUF1566 domain-containing protein [Myxococcota bacterium]